MSCQRLAIELRPAGRRPDDPVTTNEVGVKSKGGHKHRAVRQAITCQLDSCFGCTNLAFREFGIALFFTAVGLGAGAKVFSTVFHDHWSSMAVGRRVCDSPSITGDRADCARCVENELRGS